MEPHDAPPSDGAEERVVRHSGAYGLPRRKDAVLASSKFRQPLHRSSQRSGQEKPRKAREILPSSGHFGGSSTAGEGSGQGTLRGMASLVVLRGVYVAAVTPFGRDGDVAL